MIPRDDAKNRLDNSTPPREDVGIIEPGIDSDRVIVAATLAGSGWPVLALDHGTKTPAHGHSDRPNHADYWLTTPEAVVGAALTYQRALYDRGESFPDPNFGVMTGVSVGADHLALVALDVDGGTEALAELLREAGPEAEEWARDTVRVSHGDPSRCHLYGLLDARQGAMLRTMPHLGDGLEFRGLGGYIVAPGSLHPDGRTYEITGGELIVNDGGQPDHGIYDGLEDDDCNTMSARWRVPREVPLALLRVLIDRGADGVDDRDGEDDVKIKEAPGDLEELPPEPSDHRCGSGALEARLNGAVVKVRTAPPGTGNDRLNKSARVCGALVAAYPEELAGRDKEIHEELVSAFLARPTTESKGSREREARSTIKSGWESGARDWAEILADGNGEIRRSAPDPLLRSPRSAGTHDDDEEVLAVADPTAMTDQEEDGEEERPRIPASWRPISLGGLAKLGPLLPTVGADSAGRPMLYPGRLHAVNGPAETFKSWLVLSAFAVPELRKGHRVVWIDMEDEARGMALRLAQLGVHEDEYDDLLAYLNPAERMPLGPTLDRWGEELAATATDDAPLTLVAVDGMTAFLSLYGGDTNDADDLAGLIVRFFARVAKDTGAAVVWIDHKAKAAEDGRYALGSVAKMTMVSGAVFDVYRPKGAAAPRIGDTGYLGVRLTKDRPGQLKRRCDPEADTDRFPVYGTVVVASGGDGFADVSIDLLSGPVTVTTGKGPEEANRAEAVLDLLRELGADGKGQRFCWDAIRVEKERREKDKNAEELPEWMTRAAVRDAVEGAKRSGTWRQS